MRRAINPVVRSLIEQVQQGDEEAFSKLYERYVQQIYRYIRLRVSTHQDAEDLTAEVFKRAFEGLPAFQVTTAPFETWLYRIAFARIIDERRKNRMEEVELSEVISDFSLTTEEKILDAEEARDLIHKIQGLSDDYQTVLILRFVERKSHDEVAELMGKTGSSVRTLQYRALTALAESLGLEHKKRHYMRNPQS